MSTAPFEAAHPPVFAGGSLTRQLLIRRSANARKLRLVIDPRDGSVRLTLPARASLRRALVWVEEKRGWIEQELTKLLPPQPIGPGSLIPVEGVDHLVEWMEGTGRRVSRADNRLLVGGPREAISGRVVRWLRAEALRVLDAETRAFGARAGVTIARVSIGDPKGRWGSCSSSGNIRYNWRLIMAPANVRIATVAHEVAHRVHMDHSAAFHRQVERLLGRSPEPERAWLRLNGTGLHQIGREV